jgi:hypothetical protein
MIIISNFNLYIGGGEVIALDFAKYLKKVGIPNKLLCIKDSFIEKYALENELDYLSFDNKYTSLIFCNKESYIEISNIIKKEINSDFYSFLTITFRDLYNTISFLPYLQNDIRITHYVLHPEDYMYGLSLKLFNRKKHINFNLNLLNLLNDYSSIVLPNPNAWVNSFKYKNPYVPFYIENINDFNNVVFNENEINNINVITISRFVEFKISSIIGIMLHTVSHKNIKLTVVGYGRWYFLVYLISFLSKKRIKLVGKCSKLELNNLIKRNDVLYAQGTTLLLGIALGKPCLISHYSRWYDWIFGRFGSVGWYKQENKFDYGDYRIKNFNYKFHSFSNYLDKNIISNEKRSIQASFLNELNSDNVFDKLILILLKPTSAQFLNNIQLPKPLLIKSYLYKWKKW